MASIQFKGKDRILEVYNNKSVKCWSISQGSQFLEKGEGAASLEGLLDMLIADGSNAVYTIRLYDSSSSIGDVKAKTDYDASYNFKLTDYGGDSGGGGMSGALARERRIWELEQEVRDLKRDQESKKVGVIGMVTDALADPIKLGQYINIIQGLLGRPVPSTAMGALPAHTFSGSAGRSESENTEEMSEQDLTRLQNAIDTLEKNDPKIILHLEQLARLSTNNPTLFKVLLTQLETLK